MATSADILIVVNPAARRVRPGVVGHVADAWEPCGNVIIASTRRSGDATKLAREAAATSTAVVVGVGGDGTQHELAQGLVGSTTALAPVPAGSTNVLARSLGAGRSAPLGAAMLARGFKHGDVRAVAMAGVGTGGSGGSGPDVFVANVGIGFDARVVHRVERSPAHKRRFGHAHFAAAAAIEFARARRAPAFVVRGRTLDGTVFGPWSAAWVVVLRTDTYTYGGRLALHLTAPQRSGVRPTLTAVIVPSLQLMRSIRAAPGLLHRGLAAAGPLNHPSATEPFCVDDVAELALTSPDGSDLVAQADGEPLACGPDLDIRELGSTLRLVWPEPRA